jgi:hypothetical protein
MAAVFRRVGIFNQTQLQLHRLGEKRQVAAQHELRLAKGI